MDKLSIKGIGRALSFLPNDFGSYDESLKVISALISEVGADLTIKLLYDYDFDNRRDNAKRTWKNRVLDTTKDCKCTIGTLIEIAKDYGFRMTRDDFETSDFVSYVPPPKAEKKPLILDITSEPLQFDEVGNPLLTIATNTTINKNHTAYNWYNWNVPNNNYLKLGTEIISKGKPIICGHLKDDHRVKESWIKSNCFCLDIDKGLSIREALQMQTTAHAILIYTTCSHTIKENRFRILFQFDKTILNPDTYQEICKYFIGMYNSDAGKYYPGVGWYGNNNTTILYLPDIAKGIITIQSYEKGGLINESRKYLEDII